MHVSHKLAIAQQRILYWRQARIQVHACMVPSSVNYYHCRIADAITEIQDVPLIQIMGRYNPRRHAILICACTHYNIMCSIHIQ